MFLQYYVTESATGNRVNIEIDGKHSRQEPSRGHKFSIAENSCSLWNSFLLGRAVPQTLDVYKRQGVHRLGDGSLVDVGLGAQPVVLVAGGQLNGGHNGLALGLCIACLLYTS